MENRIIICKNGVRKVAPKEPHRKRQRIIDENLMEYIDVVKVSDRNKEIVKMYVAGSSFKEIAEQYNLNRQTVSDIILRYITTAHKYIMSLE